MVASSCKNNQAEQAAAAVEQAAVAVEQTAAGIATSGSYAVEPSSVIEWVGKKPTGQHKGTISLQSGALNINNGNITGDFVIDNELHYRN